jgi:cell division protein FtsB
MGIWIFLLASGCFCAGYCLSGMLGYGTREDLEREAESLRHENARLMRSNLTLQEEIELMEKEARFREKTKV